MSKTCIVLIGAPCSGKSTIGKSASKLINARYISSGDIAREMAQTDGGVNNLINNGMLAPEFEMRNAIFWEIIHSDNIIILDGFPRFGEQAEWLHKTFCEMDIKYVHIDAQQDELIRRAHERGRSDDINFIKRLEYYSTNTIKELNKYIDISIDTSRLTVDECINTLIEYIKEVSNAQDC